MLLAWATHGGVVAQGVAPAAVHELIKAERYEEALSAAEAQLAGKPSDRDLRFYKGLALSRLGRTAAALDVFHQLLQDLPNSAELHNNIAVLHVERGEFARALNALETALRLDPGYATAYENLGDVHARLASVAYARAARMDAKGDSARTKLALLERLQGAAPAESAAAATTRVASSQAGANAGGPPIGRGASSAAQAEVAGAVAAWAAAWARRDLDAYFAAYAGDFAPAGQSHEAWRESRRARIATRSSIAIDIEDLRIEVDDAGATARFRQIYRSQATQTVGHKQLRLARSDTGRWLIGEETLVPRR